MVLLYLDEIIIYHYLQVVCEAVSRTLSLPGEVPILHAKLR